MKKPSMNLWSISALLCLAPVLLLSSAFAQWELVDADTFQAITPCGERCYFRILPENGSLEANLPQLNLTAGAQAAVERAPTWLQVDLKDNFRRMNPVFQDVYADLINNSYDPYVDEICFTVAHTAPQTLSGPMDPAIITVNVSSLYNIDLMLDYADIINYGNAMTGGDYYSTIRYRVIEDDDTLEIELPREEYYWYVAHPKLHKETPNYIDPNTGYQASPPTGVFWRDYLMNCADPGYPLLRDMLSDCAVLWKSEQNTLDNGAVGVVTQWVQDVMTFQSYPHHDQPVRIYHQHIGTCSVHSYLTSAAARAALIPTAVSVMYSDNHKINEFWERRWVSWEPVNTYIDNPGGYENWGWHVAADWNWRGDSYIRDNTEQYTEVCTLQVNVIDNNGNPVDGARIKIYSSPCVAWGATAGWTVEDGFKQFLLGDSRSFTAQVVSEIGNYPASGMQTIIPYSQVGAVYTWNVVIPGVMPVLSVSPDTLPANPTDDFRVVLDYNLPWKILYGDNLDDNNRFSEKIPSGNIDFFICDEENFGAYLSGDDFQAFEINLGNSAGTIEFILPTNSHWYAIFANDKSTVLSQVLEVSAQLYQSSTSPGLVVTIEPENPPVQIPAAGGSFDFTLQIENTSTFQTFVVDLWIDAILPNGSVFGPIATRLDLTFAPGANVSRSLNQSVPAGAPPGDYTYWVHIGDQAGGTITVEDSFPFTKLGYDGSGFMGEWTITGWDDDYVEALCNVPGSYHLAQNSPNPFNPVTNLIYNLPEAGIVELVVYDIQGREVARLVSGYMGAGVHQAVFDCSQSASGMYFACIKVNDFKQTRKMLLVK